MPTRWSYSTAGLATLSRQVLLTAAGYVPGLNLISHAVQLADEVIMTACESSIVLVEQCAYPILLQISEEMDKLMADQIENEKNQLLLFKVIHPFLIPVNPLGYISLGNYIDSFQAQIDSHQAVLDYFHDLWEYKTTTVIDVIDGDSILVAAYGEDVRIEGIDCPEWDEEGGPEATAYTESRLLGKEVELRCRKKLDDYGRRIAKVYLEGKNFAYELVAEGHAKFIFWHFP